MALWLEGKLRMVKSFHSLNFFAFFKKNFLLFWAKMMDFSAPTELLRQEEFGFQSLPGLLGLDGWDECFRGRLRHCSRW